MTARQRTNPSRVAWLADRCGARDIAILESLNRLRLASGDQLERLHFTGLAGRSRSVSRWRALKRLADWQLIVPLGRRIGGSARGSAAAVYALDVAGARLLKRTSQRVRRPPTLGERKVKHTLTVSEMYVGLVERSRTDGFRIIRFDVEPHYAAGSGWISPDAYIVVTAGDVTDHWWLEVDLATESAATVDRKIQAYVRYYQQGGWAGLGVMPRVLVAVPDEARRRQLTGRPQIAEKELIRILLTSTANSYVSLVIANANNRRNTWDVVFSTRQ